MSSSIKIGTLTLDNSYSPLVNLSFEYFRSAGQEIIGGLQKYSISGTVSVNDASGVSTGSTVMSKLKQIRNLGNQTKCILVNIPNFYSGNARISNINIEQGPDPTWINQGSFTIELEAPLSSIPNNSFGITAKDSVTDISVSENIELGEESHNGYVVHKGSILNKQFVKFKNTVELTCKPLCAQNSSPVNIIDILTKLVKIGPQNSVFQDYKSWKPYSQSRSLELTGTGSASFSSEIILLPSTVVDPAFIDIEFEHSWNYESKQETKKVTGTITGLAPVSWSNIISIADTSSSSKYSAAKSAFDRIKALFDDVTEWGGIELVLTELPACPINRTGGVGRCGSSAIEENTRCFLPMTSTVSSSRTEGVINFTFEWSTQEFNNCADNAGVKTDMSVDISEQSVFAEHVSPIVGTIIQNLNCKTAARYAFTLSISSNSDVCSTIPSSCTNQSQTNFNDFIASYIGSGSKYLIIENSVTKTYNSQTYKKTYIKTRC